MGMGARGKSRQAGSSARPVSTTEQALMQPVLSQLPGTEEQEAIWRAIKDSKVDHVIVEAVAGSGKTWTIVQAALREKYRRVGLVAFNSHIAKELTTKIGGQRNVECLTYHALGRRAVADYARAKGVNVGAKSWVDQYKVLGYLDTLELTRTDDVTGEVYKLQHEDLKTARYRINTMVGFAKSYGYDEKISDAELSWLEERHDVDLNGLRDVVYANVARVLKWCKETVTSIDFDDMVWLPYVLKLPVTRYGLLCVDEYQDTNTPQQWLALQAAEKLVAVGDSRQAIYAFRGADSRGFDRLRETLEERGEEVVTLPLTLTRRCPQAHVRLAQRIVPDIRALDDAPQGKVSYIDALDKAVSTMRPGDLVVCRVNAPLVGTAYKLLKRGVRVMVRGRDIGAGINKLLEKAEKAAGRGAELKSVMEHASVISNQEASKFNAMPNGRGEQRAQAVLDRLECLVEIAGQVGSVGELQGALDRLFGDFKDEDGKPVDRVVLGTVHRTKGLEGARVFVLRPDLMPHPMAKKREEQEQERNLAYVAVTRAKFEAGATGSDEKSGELVFVGGESSLFPAPIIAHHDGQCFGGEEHEQESEREEFSRVALESAVEGLEEQEEHWDI